MKKRIVVMLLAICLLATGLVGCTQASKVSHNISNEADNFNVVRQLVVINAVTDQPVFELIGKFSFELEADRIIAIVETETGVYKKHSIGLPEVALWYVYDVSGADVNTFQYKINFQPESIIPFEFTNDY